MHKNILIKYFALIGAFCILLFALLVILMPLLSPQTDPLSYTVSEYAIGPYGFLMTIAFILRALGVGFLAVGLAMGGSNTLYAGQSRAGLFFLFLFTLCSLLVAVFPADPQHAQSFLLHSVSALLGFSSFGIAALVWSQCFRKDTLWRSSALVSLLLGLFILLSLIGFLLSPGGIKGLTERMIEFFIVVWLCFICWRLVKVAASAEYASILGKK